MMGTTLPGCLSLLTAGKLINSRQRMSVLRASRPRDSRSVSMKVLQGENIRVCFGEWLVGDELRLKICGPEQDEEKSMQCKEDVMRQALKNGNHLVEGLVQIW